MLITRFAPSPTGTLHIGSARTALFNWLYAKHCNGKYLLRIEDTDTARSNIEYTKQLIDSLQWLGLHWNDDIIIQSDRITRHQEIAEYLVKIGKAYYCYATIEEIELHKQNNQYERFKSPWRNNNDCTTFPHDKPVIRMKAPLEGTTTFYDNVQGQITINNIELNDIIILRADRTPTYLLAVVIDDHDMNVNHVIRGDDHLTNTFKQLLIYNAMNWCIPEYSHIPLIHGTDGAKLSKRHGAVGIEYYRDSGYLPEALCNYLLRLGWGGDGTQELLTKEQAISIFDVRDISKASSKFDLNKLNFINAHYINTCNDDLLFKYVMQFWHGQTDEIFLNKAKQAIPLFKTRCTTLVEIAEMLNLLVKKYDLDEKSAYIYKEYYDIIKQLKDVLNQINTWNLENIKFAFKDFAKTLNIKDAIIMQCLRASILGTFTSPSIYDMILILEKDACINRINE